MQPPVYPQRPIPYLADPIKIPLRPHPGGRLLRSLSLRAHAAPCHQSLSSISRTRLTNATRAAPIRRTLPPFAHPAKPTQSTGDIIQLARQFEVILHETHPRLVYHLLALGASPLKLVFNWIVFIFVGYLEVDQIMAVWDRVLAWDSLLIVPLVAASILAFREKRLMACSSMDDVHEV